MRYHDRSLIIRLFGLDESEFDQRLLTLAMNCGSTPAFLPALLSNLLERAPEPHQVRAVAGKESIQSRQVRHLPFALVAGDAALRDAGTLGNLDLLQVRGHPQEP